MLHAILTDTQNLFAMLPDPLKAGIIVVLLLLSVAIILPLGLAFWQIALDLIYPPWGGKFRAMVKELEAPGKK